MSEGYASLDAHAYVDNSLNPADRIAFEAAMRRDAKLKARVAAWEAQNEAIRIAFGAPPKPRQVPALARPSNENETSRAAPARTVAPPRALPAPPATRQGMGARGRAALAVFAFAAALVATGGGPADPRDALIERADASLRAATAYPDTRLDFISDDPRAVSAWLGARFAHIDARRLAPIGWALLGVRIVPGLAAPAALVVYEDALGGHGGLQLEPSDGSPALPPKGVRDEDEAVIAGAGDGFLYAAVGPARSGVGSLIPVAPNQPPP